MDRTEVAIRNFTRRYGKTPKEFGFTEIGIYEKQNAFLYAVSKEVIQAYIMQQNILRWLMKWYIWPMIVAFINFFVAAFKYLNPLHPQCWVSYIFFGIWIILFIALCIKLKPTTKLVKLGKTITFLNY